MEVSDLLGPERVFARVVSNGKPAIVEHLARLSAHALGLDAPTAVDAVLARERLGSTGIGQGIALPHARLAGIGRPYGILATLQRRIDFASIDQKPVDIVLLLLSPMEGKSHLEALAAASRFLRDPAVATRLRSAENAVQLFDAVSRDRPTAARPDRTSA